MTFLDSLGFTELALSLLSPMTPICFYSFHRQNGLFNRDVFHTIYTININMRAEPQPLAGWPGLHPRAAVWRPRPPAAANCGRRMRRRRWSQEWCWWRQLLVVHQQYRHASVVGDKPINCCMTTGNGATFAKNEKLDEVIPKYLSYSKVIPKQFRSKS